MSKPAVIEEYPDLDGDGIPDAFENRRSITEILNGVPAQGPRDEDAPVLIVEIERNIRSAQDGEWVLTSQGLELCKGYDHNRYRGYVVRKFIDA